MTLAPEHELVSKITTPEQKAEVEAYIEATAKRSERDRMADVKTISGVFTGSYAINPYNGEKVPVWVADYVLAGYGTGAVMAVPCGDQRDYDFAKHFDLPIVPVIKDTDISEQADPTKEGTMINSGFLDGLTCLEAIDKAIAFAEEKGVGKGKINYRIRDAIFARQRYWGEPVPVYFKNDTPYLVAEKDLPIILPEVDKYLPTEDGDPPLGRAENFTYTPEGENEAYPLEMSTMPGWAGSSWYWYRYMDAHNENAFIDKDVQEYWENVDLYIGGSEHATGHLLYSRFWNKILFDLGHVNQEEPFKKLINQGMIQGRSNFVYRVKGENKFVSFGLRKEYDTTAMHVDVSLCRNDELDLEAFKNWRPDLADAEFILEDGKYICGWEVEKMSKSKYNVVNPDDIIERYGADTLRLYEMFLGPLEQFKPWNTNGIDGVRKFLGKLWRLFHNGQGEFEVSDATPSKDELKSLHKTIKKAEEDIERYSFNTSVSTFMICVNELSALKCNNRAVLQDLLVVISPYAPHITEELWSLLGHETSIVDAPYPEFNEEYLKESDIEYPVMINGKMRTKLQLSADMNKAEIEAAALADETVQKWLEGKPPKKVIVVPKKIVNLVV
jgi:leucyl-tRNA synthetase